MKDFLAKYNLRYERQSGFRNNHNWESELTAIIDDWISAINNNAIVGTILLDLSKAFDLVDHNILLYKLNCYQFNDECLLWFKSYLDQRQQQVAVTGKLSTSKHISSRVPQSSVLGPLLFIIYINALALEVNKSLLDLFADDTTMTAIGTSVAEIEENLNHDIEIIVTWCKNKMSINISKTKAIFLSSLPRQALIKENPHSIKIEVELIELSDTEKLLGVIVDNHMNWAAQVGAILKKCKSLLYLFGRIRQFLNLFTRKLYVNAYTLPHLDTCCTI